MLAQIMETGQDPNPRNFGPIPVARGGSGADAPALAARPAARVDILPGVLLRAQGGRRSKDFRVL